jgi:hypothetical protein
VNGVLERPSLERLVCGDGPMGGGPRAARARGRPVSDPGLLLGSAPTLTRNMTRIWRRLPLLPALLLLLLTREIATVPVRFRCCSRAGRCHASCGQGELQAHRQAHIRRPIHDGRRPAVRFPKVHVRQEEGPRRQSPDQAQTPDSSRDAPVLSSVYTHGQGALSRLYTRPPSCSCNTSCCAHATCACGTL